MPGGSGYSREAYRRDTYLQGERTQPMTAAEHAERRSVVAIESPADRPGHQGHLAVKQQSWKPSLTHLSVMKMRSRDMSFSGGRRKSAGRFASQ